MKGRTMTDHELEKNLEELLAETGPAHHQAFIATNGEDPNWAEWYTSSGALFHYIQCNNARSQPSGGGSHGKSPQG